MISSQILATTKQIIYNPIGDLTVRDIVEKLWSVMGRMVTRLKGVRIQKHQKVVDNFNFCGIVSQR